MLGYDFAYLLKEQYVEFKGMAGMEYSIHNYVFISE